MKNIVQAFSFAAIVVGSAALAIAQPPGGPGGQRPGGPGGPGGRAGHDPGRAVLTALDTDGDQEISATEIANAATALLKLDSNGDGKLSDKDLEGGNGRPGQRAQRGGERGGRQQGPPPGVGGGGPDEGQGPPTHGADGPPGPEQLVKRAMEFDADKDGKLDNAELLKFAEQLGPPPGGPGGPGGGADGGQGRGNRQQRPARPEGQ